MVNVLNAEKRLKRMDCAQRAPNGAQPSPPRVRPQVWLATVPGSTGSGYLSQTGAQDLDHLLSRKVLVVCHLSGWIPPLRARGLDRVAGQPLLARSGPKDSLAQDPPTELRPVVPLHGCCE